MSKTDRRLEIDEFVIDDASDCYVIAEVGHNHQGSVETAKELFAMAKRGGAHAVKLQKRHNRSLFTREYYNRPYDNDNSFGATYGEHREALEFGRDEYIDLKRYADEIGITLFATAFDQPSCEFLADLDMPAFKVASADLKNVPLLRCVAEVGKPMIISTGAATLEDVLRAYNVVIEVNREIALLQCTACYPAEWGELNLEVITTYRELFPGAVVGLSSHDNGISAPVGAFVLGARVVEKHFTLNRAMRGSDHAFSLEPQGLSKMVRDLKRMRVALGDGNKVMYQSEAAPAMKMSKKLVAARDLPAGHILEEEDVEARSPGDGVPPAELDGLVGRQLKQPLAAEAALTTGLFVDDIPGGGAHASEVGAELSRLASASPGDGS